MIIKKSNIIYKINKINKISNNKHYINEKIKIDLLINLK